jgi:hypothetical protein
MGDIEQRSVDDTGGMHRRRVTMPDGRYIIYFTFDDAPGSGRSVEEVPPDADARPEIQEERAV